MTPEEELTGQLLWFEALKDAIEDGETEAAIKAIENAIKLLRKQRRQNDDERRQS